MEQSAPQEPGAGEAAPAPPSRRARKRARDETEAATRAAELARLTDAAPQSTEDFERLVLGSPHSSYVWIRYMAFLLGTAEVLQAQAIAERALDTINLRCGPARHRNPDT